LADQFEQSQFNPVESESFQRRQRFDYPSTDYFYDENSFVENFPRRQTELNYGKYQ